MNNVWRLFFIFSLLTIAACVNTVKKCCSEGRNFNSNSMRCVSSMETFNSNAIRDNLSNETFKVSNATAALPKCNKFRVLNLDDDDDDAAKFDIGESGHLVSVKSVFQTPINLGDFCVDVDVKNASAAANVAVVCDPCDNDNDDGRFCIRSVASCQ